MADYATGDLGTVPVGIGKGLRDYLETLVATLDERLVDFETRISALEDAP